MGLLRRRGAAQHGAAAHTAPLSALSCQREEIELSRGSERVGRHPPTHPRPPARSRCAPVGAVLGGAGRAAWALRRHALAASYLTPVPCPMQDGAPFQALVLEAASRRPSPPPLAPFSKLLPSPAAPGSARPRPLPHPRTPIGTFPWTPSWSPGPASWPRLEGQRRRLRQLQRPSCGASSWGSAPSS